MNNSNFPDYYGDYNNPQNNNNQYNNNQYNNNQYNNNQYNNNAYGNQPYNNQQYNNQQYNNQQYNMQQYNNQQYNNQQYNGQPYAPGPSDSPEKKKKKGNILAGISLLLFLTPQFLFLLDIFYGANATSISTDNALGNLFFTYSSLLYYLGPSCFIAAIVLIIIAKCTCPKTPFVNIVLWIIIVITVLELLVVIIAIAACLSLVKSCADGGFPAGFIYFR